MPKLDGTYCPPQEMTIDWEMSKIRYAIIIQQMDSRSVLHIKTFGTVVSGINKLDAILAESDLHTEASILKIIEMFHAGKEVRIVKKADVLKIYNVVNLFLCQWAEKITSDFLGHVYPLEELHVIEQFASYIYQRCYELGLEVKAPDQWANDFRDQGVLLSDLDTLLRGNMTKKDESKPIEIPERESLEPFFDRNLDERFKGGIFWNSEIVHSNEK